MLQWMARSRIREEDNLVRLLLELPSDKSHSLIAFESMLITTNDQSNVVIDGVNSKPSTSWSLTVSARLFLI